MKMRKTACILTALMMVFAFCMAANAQDICQNCKCEPGSVPCPETITPTEQGATPYMEETCPFDYDGERYTTTNGAWGYETGHGYNWAENDARNCKVLFDICECPDSCEFLSGQNIGIRLVITTPGVYWAGPALDTIYFDIFSDAELSNGTACANDTMRLANVYGGSGIGLDGDPILSTEVRNFGDITYYQSYTETTNANGDLVGTVAYPGVPLEGCSTLNISSQNSTTYTTDNDVIAIESDINTDYMITRDDTSRCHFWIDLPPMRIDATAEQCAAINVRIILLYDRINTGLCELCHPPITCECTRTVGYVCCEDDPVAQQCIYFPYVAINEPTWFTGIGITNLDADVDNPQLTFTLVDANGTAYRHTRSFTATTGAWSLQSMIDDWTWSGGDPSSVSSGSGWLRVQGNFQLDGLQFMVENNSLFFGGTVLPRKACEGCGGCPVITGD